MQVLTVAIQAGATTLNIPDTVGYTTPTEFGDLIRYLRENVPGAKDVIFSVHCHNDLGLATANTLAGLINGGRQVEVTINGIGERAGNTSLEEVVMALFVRGHIYDLGTDIVTSEIHRTSDMVSRYTGMVIQPNKAIVGANAFAHEAGIHQDGMLKNKRTYEIMDASTIGLHQSTLVLGKHSGRHALRRKLESMGYHLSQEELNEVFKRFKDVADKKKVITDADLEALVGDEIYQPKEIWELVNIQVQCGSNVIPDGGGHCAQHGDRPGGHRRRFWHRSGGRRLQGHQSRHRREQHAGGVSGAGRDGRHRRQRRCDDSHRGAGPQHGLQGDGAGPAAPASVQRAWRGHGHHRRQRQGLYAGVEQGAGHGDGRRPRR